MGILEKYGIINLFEIPYFGWSNEINACVKVLFSSVHGGTLCLDPLVSIDTVLIPCITGLGKASQDLLLFFLKMGERSLYEAIKDKYDTFRGKSGLDMKSINDKGVRFTT
jgi:hypothetical protein